ncbi:MAG: peptide-binding protein [Beijerinckiaceae bacterium]
MTSRLLLAAAALAATMSCAAAQQCMVSDPTGTPLNMRESPNGRILGTLRNGTFVTMRDVIELRGQRWAELAMNRPGGTVYVLREYISCRQ